MNPSIAIIGGGPSGLLLARLLELNEIIDYVVFEKDESSMLGPWLQGGTLDLHASSGQMALKQAGLFDKFNKEFARWNASRMHILNPDGETVACFGEDDNTPEIDRVQLRQLLLDSVPEEKIRWCHAVNAVERRTDTEPSAKDNGCIIHFVNGTSASGFRLIVGADGTWSKVRPLLTPSAPVYSGKMFIEGKLSHDNPSYAKAKELAGPGAILVIGKHKMIAVQQLANETYRVYFGLIVPEDFYSHRRSAMTDDLTSRTEAMRSLLLSSHDYFETYCPELKAFVTNAEGPFRSWPLHRMDPEAISWARCVAPGLTLLGDAAHATTPFVGEGVNCSMHDAVVLADYLVEHCGKDKVFSEDQAALESALAAYEKDMFSRGEGLIRRSTQSEATIFADDAPAQFLQFLNDAIANKDLKR
ncbi:FAD/NAD(P)-binding domain-containing protein [Aspergillus ellipticus CBS 707.79]|uniref:FAD/NAD(P)-binding domain-containing protein n=1 Tax=Aspergillus ellipticus CBS 707.79 TaxID=1448320 RepID=A0A319F4T1_9EURO|nr:FAD/NAD(P)-binding domain-containing protein [Aspergillus ellipticus CBS 707.79]